MERRSLVFPRKRLNSLLSFVLLSCSTALGGCGASEPGLEGGCPDCADSAVPSGPDAAIAEPDAGLREADGGPSDSGTVPSELDGGEAMHSDGGEVPPPELLVVPFANHSDTNCAPVEVMDGDTASSSRWSGFGGTERDVWLRFDLSRAVRLDEVRLYFYAGASRVASFSIDVSSDGSAWERVFTGSSSGTATGFESFPFTGEVVASSIRFNGAGNDSTEMGSDGRPKSGWNSVIEAQFLVEGAVVVGHGASTVVDCFQAFHCDDQDATTVEACSAEYDCSNTPVACGLADGLCPASCTAPTDVDCAPPEECNEGEVTKPCQCNGAVVSTGYCCENGPQTTECFSCTTDPGPGHYFVSPDGEPGNTGSATSPFATLEEAVAVVVPGDTIWLRGGVHSVTRTVSITRSGTATQPIRLWGCPREQAILDFSQATEQQRGISFTASYWHLKSFEMRYLPQRSTGVLTIALKGIDANHSTFERLDIHHNGGSSVHFEGDSTGNLFLNCDFHHNYDPETDKPGGNADGMAFAYVPRHATNTIRGCRAWSNSDDGYDFWKNEGVMLLEQTWSFNNGWMPGTTTTTPGGNGSGFKLGRTDENTDGELRRVLRGCIAANNRLRGFDQNNAKTLTGLFNNTAYGNGGEGINLDFIPLVSVVKNNLSTGNGLSWGSPNGAPAKLSATVIHSHNSWDSGLTLGSSDFVSLDAGCLDDPRKSDGSLPDCDFARLVPVSPFNDVGDDVCAAYCGAAPDLGAYERSGADCQGQVCAPLSVVTIGDSTVSSYDVAATLQRGWGQLLPGVLHATFVENRAVAGQSSKSFIDSGRWQSLLEQTRPDVVFIQFGHNDVPGKPETHYTDPGVPTDETTHFFRNNIRTYVRDTRERLGALPILVTPMERRVFDDGKIRRTNEPYAVAMRAVAAELGVHVVDLNAMSIEMYERLYAEVGADAGKDLHIEGDNTHFNAVGARLYAAEVAKNLPAGLQRYEIGD